MVLLFTYLFVCFIFFLREIMLWRGKRAFREREGESSRKGSPGERTPHSEAEFNQHRVMSLPVPT